MANYWDVEEKKRQQAQQQAQNAQNNQAVTQYAGLYKPSQTVQNAQQQLKQQQALKPNAYTPGQTVQQAQQMLQQQMQSKPGAYQSPHMQQVTQLYEQVMNRPQFKYNINADPLYQQYKNQYVQQGQRAMRDTVGTMAGLTGGFGNSYAQGAGQQEYQRYLGMLNAVMPELYGQAFAQYTQEGDELRNNLATAQQMDETEYGRYRDQMGDWQNQLNYLTGRYDTEADRDYGQYRDTVGDWQNQLNYLTGRYDTEADRDYGQYMDALGYRGDAYNLAIDMMTRGMMPDAQTLAMAGLTADQAQAYMRSLTAGTGSGGGSGGKTVFVTPEVQNELQQRITEGTSAGKLTGENALNVARQGLNAELPDAVIERQMMKTLAEQRGTGQGMLNALAYGNAMEAAGIDGPQTTANLLATKKTQMGLPTTQAPALNKNAVSQDVANKYGNMGQDYQITLADILAEEEDKKRKK